MLVYQRVYVHPPSTSRRPSQHEACGPAARCPTGGALRLHPEKLGFNTDGSEKKTRISPGKAVVDPTNMVFCWWLLLTPLKNISSSVGMMTFPTEWKVIKIHGSKPPTRLLFYQHYPLVNIPKIAGKSTHFING